MNARIFNCISKRPRLIGAALVSLLYFAGCSNDAIFASIENEVKLKDATMRGTISSMVVAGGDLYAANGYLFKKTGGTGDWNKVSLPSSAARCAEVATGGSTQYFYARMTDSDYAPQSLQRYDTSTGTWTEVTGVSNVARIGDGNGIIYAFQQYTYSDEVYLYNVYTVTGTTPTATSATGVLSLRQSSGDYFATDAGIYNKGGTQVSSITGISGIITTSAVSNGTGTNPGMLYAVADGYIYAWNIDIGTPLSMITSPDDTLDQDTETPTGMLSYLSTSAKSLLLIASGSADGGYGEVYVDPSDGSLDTFLDPGDSDISSISTSDQDEYESTIEQWATYRIFPITDAKPAADSYVLYASVIYPEYDGLWSYYNVTNSEWNRE